MVRSNYFISFDADKQGTATSLQKVRYWRAIHNQANQTKTNNNETTNGFIFKLDLLQKVVSLGRYFISWA
jgi:hypothetical protein